VNLPEGQREAAESGVFSRSFVMVLDSFVGVLRAIFASGWVSCALLASFGSSVSSASRHAFSFVDGDVDAVLPGPSVALRFSASVAQSASSRGVMHVGLDTA
jgi:hypothetical protein